MSLVPWPTVSAQTTATRCYHDGTPSIVKMPVKNTNNVFVTTLALKENRTITTRQLIGVRIPILPEFYQHLFYSLLVAC